MTSTPPVLVAVCVPCNVTKEPITKRTTNVINPITTPIFIFKARPIFFDTCFIP